MFIGQIEIKFTKCEQHAGKCLVPNKPVKSDRPGKKKMVLVKRGNKKKLLHYGDSSMSDYTQHKSKKRRENYLARSGGIKNKSGKLTKNDPFSPNHWARKTLWSRNLNSGINFSKREKEVKVRAYRTRTGRRVNPFRRRQEINVGQKEKETTIKPNNLKTLGIQAGLITASLAAPLVPLGVAAARGRLSSIRLTNYKKAASKALPAPRIGEGLYGSVQNISDKRVGKVLNQTIDPLGLGIGVLPKNVRELVTARNKEFQILKQLRNTGVTPKPLKKNRFGITMEKIEGKPLDSFLKDSLQNPNEAQLEELGKSIGQSIRKVHNAGVVHADLHANNILITPKGEVKIIDFGEAIPFNQIKHKSKIPTYLEQDLTRIGDGVKGFLTDYGLSLDEGKRRKGLLFELALKAGYKGG